MVLSVNESQIRAVGDVLNNPSRPLKERFRALFTLRNIGGLHAVSCIAECFQDESDLLKHELAYCLGQMADPIAISELITILEDKSQHPMVRHEAGEALAAIGDSTVLPKLESFVCDQSAEVSETCQIGVDRIKWYSKNNPCPPPSTQFQSIDPAPPSDELESCRLKDQLLGPNKSLFNRYRAMFALRNKNDPESIRTLAEGLSFMESALFRHEVAFVLGQLQSELAIEALKERLEDQNENEMVRHECAEALGSIGGPSIDEYLSRFLKDPSRIVRESCEIALDISDYSNSVEFQYANTLAAVN